MRVRGKHSFFQWNSVTYSLRNNATAAVKFMPVSQYRHKLFYCFLLCNLANQAFLPLARAIGVSNTREEKIVCDAMEFRMPIDSPQAKVEDFLFDLYYEPPFREISENGKQGIQFQIPIHTTSHPQSSLKIEPFHVVHNKENTETKEILDVSTIEIIDINLRTQSYNEVSPETRSNILENLHALKTKLISEDENINPLSFSREEVNKNVLFPLVVLEHNQNWQILQEEILGLYAEEGLILNSILSFKLEMVEDGRNELSLLPRKFKLIAVINEVKFGEIKLDFTSLDPDDVGKNIEISVEDIKKQFDVHYLCDRLLDAVGGLDSDVDYEAVNQRLQYLKNDPLFQNVEAYLQGTEGLNNIVGLEILVAAEETDKFQISFENTTPDSVGDTKFGINYINTNLSTVGDRLNLGYTGTTTGGIRAANLSYQVPLDAREKTLTFGFSPTWTQVTAEPFDDFDIRARSQLFFTEYRHPLIRSLDTELAFTLGFEVQNGRTFIFNDIPTSFGNGADDQGRTRTSSFTFGQEYVSRSSFGAWALNSKFYFGSDLFSATTGTWDEPGGIFSRWKGSVQRLQRLSEKHQLLIQAQWQLSPKSLASSQQFVIGGLNSVRGYRASARSADNGFRFSIEDFITLDTNEIGDPIFQLAPFIDLGWVWNNPQTSNGLSDQRFLFSTGIGLRFNELFGDEDMSARVDFAYPFINLKDKGDSLQDKGIYFSVGYTLD